MEDISGSPRGCVVGEGSEKRQMEQQKLNFDAGAAKAPISSTGSSELGWGFRVVLN